MTLRRACVECRLRPGNTSAAELSAGLQVFSRFFGISTLAAEKVLEKCAMAPAHSYIKGGD